MTLLGRSALRRFFCLGDVFFSFSHLANEKKQNPLVLFSWKAQDETRMVKKRIQPCDIGKA